MSEPKQMANYCYAKLEFVNFKLGTPITFDDHDSTETVERLIWYSMWLYIFFCIKLSEDINSTTTFSETAYMR